MRSRSRTSESWRELNRSSPRASDEWPPRGLRTTPRPRYDSESLTGSVTPPFPVTIALIRENPFVSWSIP